MADSDSLIGQTIAHYRILEKIGEGAMGVVYRATDEKLHRDVALKCLHPDAKASISARKQLIQEALAASALNHPNICTIYDVGEGHDEEVFIAMEFVAGQSLREAIPVQGMPAESVIRWGAQIADALDHAHRHGVIHRDLKSQNVVVTPEGRAKVLDFGLAQQREVELEATTQSEETLAPFVGLSGTVPYMAPELLRGAPADTRSDIWALGVVLYEMATGTLPFRGETGFAVTSAIMTQLPKPLPQHVLSGLRAVIGQCLVKDPRQRIQHAGEVRAALEIVASSTEDLSTAAAPIDPEAVEIPALDTGLRWWKPLLVVGSLAVVLALTLWGFNAFHFRDRFFAVPSSHPIKSIAVLPLVNFSADLEQTYFADGMTEELINALSRIRALRVISRTSVMKYKDTHKSLSEIARELKVDALVEGTVQRSDGRVKISADLVDAREDRNLWGHSYEGELRNILSLQSEVAQAIANEIQVQLTPEEAAILSERRAVDPQAYETYLRALYLWNKRTPEDLRRALDEFKKAVDQDPTSALAWAGLADCYTLLVIQGEVTPREAMPLAEAAVKKAIELDHSLAQAHASFALIELAYEWNTASAGEEFARAIALNPNYAIAHEWYGLYLNYSGRFEEALEEMQRAQDLDPLSVVIEVNVGRCYYFARHYDRASKLLKQLEQKEPNSWFVPAVLGQTYLANGKFDDAIRELDRARTLSPATLRNLGVLGDAYGRAGRRSEALKIASDLESLSRTRYVPPVYSALVQIGLGDKASAFAFLDKAYAERSEWMMQLNVEPEFDPLRSDPRFQALLRRVAEAGPSPPN